MFLVSVVSCYLYINLIAMLDTHCITALDMHSILSVYYRHFLVNPTFWLWIMQVWCDKCYEVCDKGNHSCLMHWRFEPHLGIAYPLRVFRSVADNKSS